MKKISLSNAALKNIAYLTMLIDHFLAVVFTKIIRQLAAAGYETDTLIQIRQYGRAIGRMAFVLFAFLIVEGFVHTRSRPKYLLRLTLLALVSEVPFDLAFSGKIVNNTSQNTLFTLSIGMLVLMIWEWAASCAHMLYHTKAVRDIYWHFCVWVFRGVQFGALLLGCLAAYMLHVDYRLLGVPLIFVFYILHDKPFYIQIVPAACVMFPGTWVNNYIKYTGTESPEYIFRFSMRELYGLIAFVPIALYDGTKGRQFPKAIYYGFYPVHLLLLYGIAKMIAIG